jgi:hypothetical protein
MIAEKDLLEICKKEIETLVGWGASDNWNNQDFEDLSEKIIDKTRVRLSVSTLKRIWGKVRYESTPNAATLNALAVFIGHENWKSFRRAYEELAAKSAIPGKKAGSNEENSVEPGRDIFAVAEPETGASEKFVSTATAVPALKTIRHKRFPYLRSAAIAVVIIPVVLYFFSGFRKNNIEPAKPDIVFQSHKLTDDLPNSVIFTYDLSNVKGDSFFIQQNWDPRRRQRISPKDKKHSSIYYYPGNFTARLIVNNETKKQSRVFIQTRGWKGIIERSPLPVYLSDADIRLPNGMGVSAKTLSDKISSPIFNEVYTEFDNIREFDGLNLNNFVFEATLQNTSSVEQALCRKVSVNILAIGTAITIPLADKGCASILDVFTGDTVISGRDNDLSKLGVDFNKPHRFKCEVKNEQLKVYIDNEEVFVKKGQKISTPIIGLKLMFEGSGIINDVSLAVPGKEPVYKEKF